MPHSNESVLTQTKPVKYTNKKTTDIKLQKLQNYKKSYQKILVVNKKNLILANITMNDKRGQERCSDQQRSGLELGDDRKMASQTGGI